MATRAVKRWASTDGVRQRILDATVTVFRERGYTAATMADIVAAADASIGSVYHHFGAKEDLFLACFHRLRDQLREAAGIDPGGDMPPYGEWEERYLWGAWAYRDEAAVFLGPDTPPMFKPGERVAEYYASLGPHTARILASIVLEAMRILSECPTERDAEPVIAATVRLLNVVRAAGF